MKYVDMFINVITGESADLKTAKCWYTDRHDEHVGFETTPTSIKRKYGEMFFEVVRSS